MPYVILDHTDGAYSTRPFVSDAEALAYEAKGGEIHLIQDAVYRAWIRHCEEGAAFDTMWNGFRNEAYHKREIAELRKHFQIARDVISAAKETIDTDPSKS